MLALYASYIKLFFAAWKPKENGLQKSFPIVSSDVTNLVFAWFSKSSVILPLKDLPFISNCSLIVFSSMLNLPFSTWENSTVNNAKDLLDSYAPEPIFRDLYTAVLFSLCLGYDFRKEVYSRIFIMFFNCKLLVLATFSFFTFFLFCFNCSTTLHRKEPQ